MSADFTPPTDDEATLRTERLVLRPCVPDHAPLVFEHAQVPALSRTLVWAPHRDVGETKAFLRENLAARRKGKGWTWSIFEEGQFRGLVGVEGVARVLAAVRLDRAELGYWIGMPFHGRGLVTEAASAAAAFGFARLGLHKIHVHAMAHNAASLAVIRKLGFTRIGTRRQDLRRDGVWHDCEIFEMLADDPAAVRLQSLLRRVR